MIKENQFDLSSLWPACQSSPHTPHTSWHTWHIHLSNIWLPEREFVKSSTLLRPKTRFWSRGNPGNFDPKIPANTLSDALWHFNFSFAADVAKFWPSVVSRNYQDHKLFLFLFPIALCFPFPLLFFFLLLSFWENLTGEDHDKLYNFCKMYLNSIRVGTARGLATYKYPPCNTMQKIPSTNSNPLPISWRYTSFSPTDAVQYKNIGPHCVLLIAGRWQEVNLWRPLSLRTSNQWQVGSPNAHWWCRSNRAHVRQPCARPVRQQFDAL